MFILFALGARPRPRLPVFGFSVTVIQPLRQPLAKPSDFPTEIDGSQWISMVGVIHSWGPLLEPSINWGLGCVVLTDRFSCFRLCHLRPHGVLPGAPCFWGPEIWIQISLDRFTPPLGISNHKVGVQFVGSDHVYNFNMCVCVYL